MTQLSIKNIYLVCSKSFYKNEIFNLQSPHNRDNCNYPYYLLREHLRKEGVSLNTYDYVPQNSQEDYALLFFDFPSNFNEYQKKHPTAKKFLLIYESPIKNSLNHDPQNLHFFEKIFSWKKSLVDNTKYFWVPYSQNIPPELNFSPKKELCCAIFGHKLQTHQKELYSERIQAIRWFENHHPEEFNLYGEGWDKHYFKDRLFLLNRFSFLTKRFKPQFPSFKGSVKEKKQTYQNYKFALCYENAEFDDYVSEKIFDCFFGGTVPIYLGAPNVATFIPENTFIDKRKFATYEDLYKFLTTMPEAQYQQYLVEIKKFVESDNIYPFSANYFANTITKEIVQSSL